MAADFFGFTLFWSAALARRRRASVQGVREILVIRTAYIGDVIMTLPMLGPLKRLFPESRITFLTSSHAHPVLLDNPYVDDILVYDAFWFHPKRIAPAIREYLGFRSVLRSRRYDLVIEARGDIRDLVLLAFSARSRYRLGHGTGGGRYLLTHVPPASQVKHRVEYHLDLVRFLGGQVGEGDRGFCPTRNEIAEAARMALRIGLGPSDLVIGIHPGGRKPLKCWPSSKYAELARQLAARCGAKIIFTGTISDRALIRSIMTDGQPLMTDLSGRTDLRQLAALMKHFTLFVCNDTGPAHLAAAMGVPTVAIFGPSKSAQTRPFGERSVVVEKAAYRCRLTCDEHVCREERYNACIRDIRTEEVLARIKYLVRRHVNPSSLTRRGNGPPTTVWSDSPVRVADTPEGAPLRRFSTEQSG